MSYESITVEPVSPHIGAEIGNIDLTKPLTNRQVQDIYEALLKYQVIFFRDQKISFDDHSEQVFNFDIVHLRKGGAKEIIRVEP